MIILLNIGNTHTHIAEVKNGKIVSRRKIQTSDLNSKMLPEGVPLAAATVVPEIRTRLKVLDVFWVGPNNVCELDFSQVDNTTLGADRVANLVALSTEYPLPALCIDFGTAITFELLGCGNIVLGGAIMPGRALMRKAMRDYTAQLPLVSVQAPPPDGPGTNTADQMLLGVDIGLTGAIKELIEVMRDKAGKDLRIVATGGDAEFFTKRLSGIEYAGDDFTLKGILKAWETHKRCK